MRSYLINLLFLVFGIQSLFAQIVITLPEYPTELDSIVITFDASQPGAEELLNYSGTLYAHTGVTVDSLGVIKEWQYVKGNWGNNNTQPSLTRLGANLYKLTIGFPRTFYNITNQSLILKEICLVVRSADGSLQTRPDIFIDIYRPGLNLIIQNPGINLAFGDPLRSPAFVKPNDTLQIQVVAVEIQTEISSLELFVNNVAVAQSDSTGLLYDFIHSDFNIGSQEVLVVGTDTAGNSDSTSFVVFVNPNVQNVQLPADIEHGINYIGGTSAVLALYAPLKEFIYVVGDFNDWKVDTSYYMMKYEVSPDSVVWWIELNNLVSGNEYAFQYLVDGEIRTGDPYSEKILDPWNDQYISNTVYPSLKPYPSGKTAGIVSILKTGQEQYNWTIENFDKPPKENLVIYELLLRDFIAPHSFQKLQDTLSYLKSLGVNAVELMPIMEFSGNNSWGYNPIYHVAVDKAYGPANTLKAFIDLCHQNDMAVILDMVLNHADNLSPLAMLWWDYQNQQPAANSPYFNIQATHPFSVFNDFNHESNATKYFTDRVNKYWLEEFKFDGYRFDLSKGFTQFNSGGNVGLWGQYDQSRINLLKRMADKIWEVDSTAYIILEHFADNSEETVLANYGMLLWGNMNYQYLEASMGYASNLNGASYKSRGWNVPHLIAYMESHDEERMMYKNIRFGNSTPDYNIKNSSVALNRVKLAAAFFFTIPGPKMLWQFGEIGYDYSIFYDPNTGTVPEPYGTDYAKTAPKPIRWDYLNDARRTNVYKVFQALINLKKNYEVFSTNDFTLNVNNSGKQITLRHQSMDVAVVGNFSVNNIDLTASFTQTGKWYDFFTGDSIDISNLNTVLSLERGEFHIFSTALLPTPEAGILSDVETIEDGVVTKYQLGQNYPNPFNPSTIINYQILEPGNVTIKIYDMLGREVKTLVNQEQGNGVYRVEWNGINEIGSKVSSGIYFYRIETGSFIDTKKMILLR
jgi:1,4-alpha-glucan branching enzyme